MTKLSSASGWSWPVEAAALTALAFAVHAAVLAWIYPGFYDPLWPHHSDFYIGTALAHSPISYLQYLSMPRSLGMLFFEITGHLGIRGAIALMSYQQPAMALRCLEASILKIPENAYLYYYGGLVLEQLNQVDEAKLYFEKAVAHDDTKGPNPAFKEALQRSEKNVSERTAPDSNKH